MSDRIPWYTQHKVDIPEGEEGAWRVERFTVSKKEADWDHALATFSFSSGGRSTPAGTYTRLMRGRTLVMSDTPDEIRDHLSPIWHSKEGDVCLVNGLGLGMVAAAMIEKGARVVVVERSKEVICLVGEPLQERYNGALEIVHADALEHKPPRGSRYAVAWHDIWDNICSDNLPDMHRLHRKYGRRCDWQGSWGRDAIEARR